MFGWQRVVLVRSSLVSLTGLGGLVVVGLADVDVVDNVGVVNIVGAGCVAADLPELPYSDLWESLLIACFVVVDI